MFLSRGMTLSGVNCKIRNTLAAFFIGGQIIKLKAG